MILRYRPRADAAHQPFRVPAEDRLVLAQASDGEVLAVGAADGADRWVIVPERVQFRFRAGSSCVDAQQFPGSTEGDLLDAFYGTALPLAVQSLAGLEVIHASAVCIDGPGVLAFSGVSGSGKSTIAHALSLRGHTLWADDAVAFDTSSAEAPTTVALPFIQNLKSPTAERFGLAPTTYAPGDVRTALEDRRERLHGIFLVGPPTTRDSVEPNLQRTSPSDALEAILPNAYRFRPESGERRAAMMASYLELVATVPVFDLRYDHDFDRMPELLDTIEAFVESGLELSP